MHSGTNGYVIRNLSTLRSHQTGQDRSSAWDVAPPKHREPDQGILDHERKRQVEIKCLELQLELEDKEYVWSSYTTAVSKLSLGLTKKKSKNKLMHFEPNSMPTSLPICLLRRT